MKLTKTFEELENEEFSIISKNIGDELCYLIIPKHIGIKWTTDNLIYRSSIWNSEGNLISASFKKFFNHFEGNDVVKDPTDDDLINGSLVDKIDGSTLITSCYNGQLIHRTRGTFNAEALPNGNEIELLKKKYPKVFKNNWIKNDFSLLYEWTTPTNVIVLNYGTEPELRLIGGICHIDYTMLPQSNLDTIATELGVERPERYEFASIPELIKSVKSWENKEGIVCYYNNGQDIKKFKSDQYLKLHRFKSNATTKNVVEMYIDNNFKTLDEYREYIKNTFDWECFQLVEFYIGPVIREHIKLQYELMAIKNAVQPLKTWQRKDAAFKIINDYVCKYRGIAFTYLDEKEVDNKLIKELLLERIKENYE